MTESNSFQGYLEPRQAKAVATAVLRTQRGNRLSTIAIFAGVVCLVLGIFQFARSNTSGATQWIILGVIVVLIAGAFRISEWRGVVRSIIKQEMKGSVEAEGVRLAAAQSETVFRWASFQRSEEMGSVVVLWLAEGQALPLAEHMFATPGAFTSVVSKVRAQIRAT